MGKIYPKEELVGGMKGKERMKKRKKTRKKERGYGSFVVIAIGFLIPFNSTFNRTEQTNEILVYSRMRACKAKAGISGVHHDYYYPPP